MIYGDAEPETYLVALSVATGEKADALLHDRPDAILARLEGDGHGRSRRSCTARLWTAISAILCCARSFAAAVFGGDSGELVGAHTRAFRNAWTSVHSNLEPQAQPTEPCYTVINYGDDFVLKLYRKLEEGINPGREVPEFLAEQTEFKALPQPLGSLEYRRYQHRCCPRDEPGHAQQFYSQLNQGMELHLGPSRPVFRTRIGHPAG